MITTNYDLKFKDENFTIRFTCGSSLTDHEAAYVVEYRDFYAAHSDTQEGAFAIKDELAKRL